MIWDTFLQRLFSTFPNSWPGFGLLLLRLCLAIALLNHSVSVLFHPSEPIVLVQHAIEALGAVLLIGGLWTPVTAILIALDEAWVTVFAYTSGCETTWGNVFTAALAISVAMLGPGAWSIDARLFGRQRFHLERTRGRQKSL